MSDIETVGDALPKEIERIIEKRDRWIKMVAENPSLGAGMNIAIAMMQSEIMQAVKVSTEGDAVGMIRSLESLRGYSDDD